MVSADMLGDELSTSFGLDTRYTDRFLSCPTYRSAVEECCMHMASMYLGSPFGLDGLDSTLHDDTDTDASPANR